ncbi:hypothetical protein Pla52n_33130 [Stieleria varia]|uniref:Uncharacterized protein n=1 Tax=Stieleria varia TaxID=2528005 RepID=A0A5C6AQD7_9BACT|nr:hypothetical protein Pla52n_33130 [Stieleria varia]
MHKQSPRSGQKLSSATPLPDLIIDAAQRPSREVRLCGGNGNSIILEKRWRSSPIDLPLPHEGKFGRRCSLSACVECMLWSDAQLNGTSECGCDGASLLS